MEWEIGMDLGRQESSCGGSAKIEKPVLCDVLLAASMPLGRLHAAKETCALLLLASSISKRDTAGTRDSFQAKTVVKQSIANRQTRGPGASLVTTASCPVKEGALTIRFGGPDLRPQASKINSWRFQHGPCTPRIPVMSPMPPFQPALVLPSTHQNRLLPASQKHLRLLSLFSAHSPFLHLIQ